MERSPTLMDWQDQYSKKGYLAKRYLQIQCNPHCLSQGFYSCTNIMTKKQVREEKVYSVYTSILLFIIEEVRTGIKQIRKQELMQRQWRDVAYWLSSPGLVSLLSYRRKTSSPEMAPPTRGPPPLITN